MKIKKNILFVIIIFARNSFCQTIEPEIINGQGTVCSKFPSIYNISNAPSGCNIFWSVSNGTKNYTDGTPSSTQMSITWDDTPGAIASITVTFCKVA